MISLPDPVVNITLIPNGPTGNFTLVFNDEFIGTSLNSTYWSNSWFDGGRQNGVSTSADNVSVGGGYLTLRLSSSTVGASVNTNPSDHYEGNSAKTGFQFITGVVEARINFPGNGTSLFNWPAFWTTGQSWPADGENDIAEVLGPGQVTVNYHSNSGSHNQGAIPGYWGGKFHTYTLERLTTKSNVYYDGVLVKSYASDDTGNAEYIVINLGAGSGPLATGEASQVVVDYVRAWTVNS